MPKWVVNDMDGELEKIFDDPAPAHEFAKKLSGNNPAATVMRGEITLYGPGDGTTSHMVQMLSDEMFAVFFPPTA